MTTGLPFKVRSQGANYLAEAKGNVAAGTVKPFSSAKGIPKPSNKAHRYPVVQDELALNLL
jgi:hypothetical protein